MEKNWHELHENKVIRASLGGIRIRKLTLQHNCHFSLLSNSLPLPQNIQNSTETTLGPYDLVFIQLVPVFSAWWPFWNNWNMPTCNENLIGSSLRTLPFIKATMNCVKCVCIYLPLVQNVSMPLLAAACQHTHHCVINSILTLNPLYIHWPYQMPFHQSPNCSINTIIAKYLSRHWTSHFSSVQNKTHHVSTLPSFGYIYLFILWGVSFYWLRHVVPSCGNFNILTIHAMYK